jgi:uncharacterized protein (DUF4415 family)
MKKRKDDPAAKPDKDNPEWTAAEIKKARPALDVVDEVFGKHASAQLRRGRSRPPKEDRKVNQTSVSTRMCWQPTASKARAGRRTSTKCCASICHHANRAAWGV